MKAEGVGLVTEDVSDDRSVRGLRGLTMERCWRRRCSSWVLLDEIVVFANDVLVLHENQRVALDDKKHWYALTS